MSPFINAMTATPAQAATTGRPHSGKTGTVRLDPVEFHALTERQTVQHILNALNEGRGGWVITANLDHYCRARRESQYQDLVAHADLVVADGMPIVWASRLKRTPLPERVAGSDLVHSLSAAAADHGRSIFLLGGSPGTAEMSARILSERYPKLDISGTYFPPFGFENDEDELSRIRSVLRAASPDIVLVALGSPKQERLINDLRKQLTSAWLIGVGISFSFLSGEVRRAPGWVQRIGAEWVHRLIQEPRRLARRYLIEGIPCGIGLLWRSWRDRSNR